MFTDPAATCPPAAMSSILIKDLPPELHEKLKASARRNHRSMNKEAIALLARALEEPLRIAEPPGVYRATFPLTDDFLDAAKAEGRK